jgi:hypothetical protein
VGGLRRGPTGMRSFCIKLKVHVLGAQKYVDAVKISFTSTSRLLLIDKAVGYRLIGLKAHERIELIEFI